MHDGFRVLAVKNPQKALVRIPLLHTLVHTWWRGKDPAYRRGHQANLCYGYYQVRYPLFTRLRRVILLHTASSPMTAATVLPAAGVATIRSTLLLPLVVAVAEAVELFRGTDGRRLDLQRGHQAWSGPSNQASMHCGITDGVEEDVSSVSSSSLGNLFCAFGSSTACPRYCYSGRYKHPPFFFFKQKRTGDEDISYALTKRGV